MCLKLSTQPNLCACYIVPHAIPICARTILCYIDHVNTYAVPRVPQSIGHLYLVNSLFHPHQLNDSFKNKNHKHSHRRALSISHQ